MHCHRIHPLGVANNAATDKTFDRDAYYGRVGYVYGGAIDKPLVMLRQDYGDHNFRAGQNPKPYRRFEPFALYPQWDLRGEPSLGTSADGGISRCEMDGTVKRCTYGMAWTQVWAPTGKPIDPLVRGWAGSLLQDKREPNGLLYRRNRYLDPATGRFTQPDPIGLAGGLNAYGYAAGDPVSFNDPFGLFDLRILGDSAFVAGIENLRRTDANVDAVLTRLESAKGLFVIAQDNARLGGWSVGGRSFRGGPDETAYANERAREIGVTAPVRGLSLVGPLGSTPLAWIAGHEAIHLSGIVDRGIKYRHTENAFDENRARFQNAGYYFPGDKK